MANLQQEVFNLRRQVASLKKQIKGGYTPISEPKYTPQNLSRKVASVQGTSLVRVILQYLVKRQIQFHFKRVVGIGVLLLNQVNSVICICQDLI